LGYLRSSAARTRRRHQPSAPFVSPKTQNPVTFCRVKTTGGNGISGKFPARPEHLSRAFKQAANVQAGLLASHRFRLAMLHSGATARDSHPLPYSPRFYARHLNALSKITRTRRTIALAFV